MAKFYLIFGLFILVSFAFASWDGTTFGSMLRSGSWKPAGKSFYHK